MSGLSSARELARNVRFAASFATHALLDDPVWLAIQAVRRAPSRVRAVVVRALGLAPSPSAPRALSRYLAGDSSGAADESSRLLQKSGGRSRIGAEVAVAVGRPDLLDGVPSPGPAGLRALWQRGDVTALRAAHASGRAEQRVLSSLLGQVDALAPRAEVRSRVVVPSSPGPTAPLAVLHHLTNSLPHTQSGYTLRSHAVLTAQRDAGMRVEATTRAGYPVTIGSLGARAVDVVDGISYRRLIPSGLPNDPARRSSEATDLLVRAPEAFEPDVLHTTTPGTNGEVTRAAAERLGIPWVYEVRGLPEETWVASHGTPEAREVAERSERRALLRAKETELAVAADAVVTLSATMRDELVSRGVPSERISVVPNAVRSSLLTEHPAPAAARASLGLPEVSFVVGTVSSLVGYEGHDTILRTVALLRQRGLDVTALVVGDGVARPGLLRLADELGLGPHAILPGRVPHEQAALYMAALDAFLVPRRDDRVTRLVTPLKPVEAMAIGRPVIASDLPALAEVLDAPRGGLLVAPDDLPGWADAIESLQHDPALAGELVARGRVLAGERTWAKNADAYRGIYRRCLGFTA
ncbi:glycosyltransferase [Oerskovia sp. Sa1BUA8]|uniref:D-inositol 3-phosphate glycosyltransferase n=1 Tax=Oerskovia douganii TaxID=2762210 RepID=A0A9D5UCH0_9CELL|nr:glycosyltransferase [Oerskovia douganii]MBE7701491.1 glycosyltransferase [Oerskovia douganii]